MSNPIIKELFTDDVINELRKVAELESNTNPKSILVFDILRRNNIDFEFMINSKKDRYVINMQSSIGKVMVKIALDSDGMTENQKESEKWRHLYPYVVELIDILQDGLIAVFEYALPLSLVKSEEVIEND